MQRAGLTGFIIKPQKPVSESVRTLCSPTVTSQMRETRSGSL